MRVNKIKGKILIISALIVLSVILCCAGFKIPIIQFNGNDLFSIELGGTYEGYSAYRIVDEETGVHYVFVPNTGIVPRYNSDGTAYVEEWKMKKEENQ